MTHPWLPTDCRNSLSSSRTLLDSKDSLEPDPSCTFSLRKQKGVKDLSPMPGGHYSLKGQLIRFPGKKLRLDNQGRLTEDREIPLYSIQRFIRLCSVSSYHCHLKGILPYRMEFPHTKLSVRRPQWQSLRGNLRS
jgi:hypothetical protein